jgi:hypothetical protein
MRQRQIKSEDIARARADEHSRREDEGSSQNAREDLEKLAFAKAFDGKYEAAANIFESFLELQPGDPDVTNNLGFCLTPSDPKAAAKCFEEAGAGTTTPTLTALNFALPQHLVGDNRLAQAKAVAALAEVGGSMIRELLCGTPTMQATVIVERIGWEHGLTALKGRVRVLHPFYLPLDPA